MLVLFKKCYLTVLYYCFPMLYKKEIERITAQYFKAIARIAELYEEHKDQQGVVQTAIIENGVLRFKVEKVDKKFYIDDDSRTKH